MTNKTILARLFPSRWSYMLNGECIEGTDRNILFWQIALLTQRGYIVKVRDAVFNQDYFAEEV